MLKKDTLQLILLSLFHGKDFPVIKTVTRMKGGLCNLTWRLDTNSGVYICQELHTIITSDIITFAYTLSQTLAKRGWKIPQFACDADGKPYTVHNGTLYRVYPYIEGTNIEQPLNATQAVRLGEVLAQLHNDLSALQPDSISSIPHFHDTRHIMEAMKARQAEFQNIGGRAFEIFGLIGESWKDISAQKDTLLTDRQIIHGDARIQNYLQNKEGLPFTMIDPDTFMAGSVFIDIGDLLRSVTCTADQVTMVTDWESVKGILEGYQSATIHALPAFEKQAAFGLCLISLELSARFLTDIIDDKYFGWDEDKYTSRAENNLARAEGQYRIFKEGKQWLKTGKIPQ